MIMDEIDYTVLYTEKVIKEEYSRRHTTSDELVVAVFTRLSPTSLEILAENYIRVIVQEMEESGDLE